MNIESLEGASRSHGPRTCCSRGSSPSSVDGEQRSALELQTRYGPSGVHLFDRTTGFNILMDEMIPSETAWSPAPRQVSIALTNACDLACPYCYAPKQRVVLNADTVMGWLSELDADGCLGVGFGGGEPTLFRQLPDLCRYAAHDTGLAVTFTTHAHRFNDRLVSALQGHVHFVRVSMDGVGETYEALRGRSFRLLLRRLNDVRKVAPFGINFVVNARTFPDLDAAVDLAAAAGAVEFLLLPEQPVRGGGGIDTHTAESLRRWVDQYAGLLPLTMSEAGSEGMPTCNPVAGEAGLSAFAHVDASGILKRSSFHTSGMKIGTEGLMQALERLRFEEREQQP